MPGFLRHTVQTIRFDQVTQHLYVLHVDPVKGNSGEPLPGQSPRGILAFDMSTPGAHPPLSGSFPIPLFAHTSPTPRFAVDERGGEGHIYYADGGKLYGWDSDGSPLGGNYPVTLGFQPDQTTPFFVDALGYLWIESKKYDPDGTFLESASPPVETKQGLTYVTHHIPDPVSYEEHILIKNADGTIVEDVLAPPDADYRGIAFNESTGELYAYNDQIGTGSPDDPKFGRVAVYSGLIVPDLSTGPPLSVGHTNATVTGHADPIGGLGITDCRFQYLAADDLDEVQAVTLTGATGGTFTLNMGGEPGSGPIPYNATATEVRLKIEGTEKVGPGEVTVSGSPGGPYTIRFIGGLGNTDLSQLIAGSSSLTPSGAKATATTVNNGGQTAWENDSSSVACSPAAAEGSPLAEPTDVSAELSGLETGVEYRYRLVAANVNGHNIGLEEALISQPSLVKTGAANSITRTSATLSGTADPEGLPSTFYFEYGMTKAYGSTSSAPPGESVGTTTPGDQPVSKGITGLQAGTTYHYRLVEVNSKGTSYGVDRTFTAETAVKHLATHPAEPVGRVSATLKGTLDPDGMGTNYYFEYGASKRYGQETATPPGGALADTTPGDQSVSAGIEGLKPDTTYHFRLVAENATYGTTKGQDRTFTTLPSIKDLETEAATGVLPTEATLNGSLDPDGYQTTFYFEYGKTKFYGHTIGAPPGEDVGTSAPGSLSLSKTLEGLEPGTTYHYRIVGENETGATAGADETFKTPQAPSIEGVFSSDVTASSANLRGRINPNGTEPSFETTYRFQYGTTTAYGQSVPVGDGTLAPAIGGQNVSVPISGLSEVTYHFRLVAENDWGTAVSEDQTLDFKAPSSCPNTTVRQQTGAAYLPDCRAYELVSPANAGGAVLSPDGPDSPYAASRFAYSGAFTAIPGAGDPPNGFGEALYVATRTTAGWVTRYVGLSGSEALGQSGNPGDSDIVGNGGVATDRSLSTFLTWRAREVSLAVTEPGAFAPYRWENEGNSLGRLPTNLDEVPGADTPPSEGGFTGDAKLSGDGRHYVFSSVGAAFDPDGLTESPGSVYDNDIATGTLTVVSKTPAEADIPKDGAAGSSGEYIRIPAVSHDGSHILMSTAASSGTHLYMSVDGTEHYEVSLGEDELNHGVRFEGMSEDGTEVFFTTAVQMTGDDEDTSVDLYRWAENGGAPTLERLSVGDEGSYGDSDFCNPAWTTRCDVEAVQTDNRFLFGSARYHAIDTALAAKGGEIYFFSPEELEGSHGVPNLRNLYLWREGAVHHVATLAGNSAGEGTRINVSPDGKYMAFVTKTKIGSYDNAGHAEMYRYDPATRELVCVSCKSDGPPPTSDVEASQNGNFMTEDGRTFFSTEDALVPRDANGIRDVYEYVGGRAQLITSGTGDIDGSASNKPIGLVGVSADGTDAFVSTYETLVGQDENGPFLKFYDARVNGGFPFNKPPAPCAAADECHGEGSSSPVAPTIGTGAGLGAGGNVTEAAPRKQAKHRQARCRRQARQRHQAGQRRKARCRHRGARR
jgi:hypothetical protein